MRLFDRKSRLERLLENMPPSRATKAGVIAASGVAALTAVSARVSSIRRRRIRATGQ